MTPTTPLLPFSTPSRKHYLDNLRCTLTVLLVIQHALIETTIAQKSGPKPVLVAIAINNAFLWSTFYFVSGYATALSQAFRPSTFRTFAKRESKVIAPALIYAFIGQHVVFHVLSKNWPSVFGTQGGYAKFSGPILYVFILFIFDTIAVILHQFTFPQWMHPSFTPSLTIIITFSLLATYTFFSAALALPSVPTGPYPLFISRFIYDTPNSSFPLSHIIAYTAGWQFKSLKRTILSSSTNSAVYGLLASIVMSLGSLYVAQWYWESIYQTIAIPSVRIATGFTAPSAFVALWETFTFFTIPISLLSIFFHSDSTNKSWGVFGRRTYLQTYIHMIPILVAEYHLRKVGNGAVMYGLTVLLGVLGTWVLALWLYSVVVHLKRGSIEARRRLRW